MNAGKGNSPAMLWLIHLSFMTAVPIYAVLTRFVLVPQQAGRGAGLPPGVLAAVLGGVALANIVMAQVLGLKLNPPSAPVGEPSTGAPAYLAKATTCLIVTDAAYEAIAVYGLVGVILGLQPWQGYLFMAVSLVILLARIAQLRAWTDEYLRLKAGEAIRG